MMRNDTHRGWQVKVLAAAAALFLASALALAGTASAKTLHKWVYAGNYPQNSFTGGDAYPGGAPSGGFPMHDLRADQANNALYAAHNAFPPFGEPQDDRIYKFNFAGKSSIWSAYDPNTWIGYTHANNKFAVDNSGTETQGRIYVASTDFFNQGIYAYLPSGQPYTEGNFPLTPSTSGICGISVDDEGDIWVGYYNTEQGVDSIPNGFFEELNPEGEPTGAVTYSEGTTPGSGSFPCDIENDSKGNLYHSYIWQRRFDPIWRGGIAKFSPDGVKHRGPIAAINNTENSLLAVDRSTDDLFVTTRPIWYEGGPGRVFQFGPESGLESTFGLPEGSYPGLDTNPSGIAVNEDDHSVYVLSNGRVDKFVRQEWGEVPIAKTTGSEPTPTSATLRGIVDADGIDTTNCYFQWGVSFDMANTAPCIEGNVFTAASGEHTVHAEIGGLTKGQEYHYRLVAKNANGIPSYGIASAFRASSPPSISGVTAARVDTGGGHLLGEVVPNGSITHYRFEYGTEPGNYTTVAPSKPPENAQYEWMATEPKKIDIPVAGLDPETTYYWRFVAENDAGVTSTPELTFRTFAKDPPGDKCANAHVRQQTGTRLLLDCRAYELVSAANAGGYDVESNISPGQEPLITSPDAPGRALYSLHFGSVPGVDANPTNFGHDPYLAVRGSDGWKTRYVGLPADAMADPEPYGSPLLGSDAGLTQFAFGGENICDPCFADGSVNIPLRRAGDTIEKGIRGSNEVPANRSGIVRKPFSDDGSHFVFGTNSPVADGGLASGSIYDRNLKTGTTQVVSTQPDGATIPGGDVAELGISSDGSRIVVAKKLGTDGSGNDLWHPYMHIGTSPNSVDLAPGAGEGVIFAGMSADGTRVFYATRDNLVGADTDESADVYMALVSGSGTPSLSLVSVDGTTPVNSDACAPPEEWNTGGDGEDCGAVAFAGGAGVSGNGAIYFLSPELLGEPGEGEAGQANVYLQRPDQPVEFVATIDTSVGKPPAPPPSRPVENAVFANGLNEPESLAVDQSNGDIYALEVGASRLSKFDSSGAAKNYTAGPGSGTNQITGLSLANQSRRSVAVDNSGGSFDGNVYVNSGATVRVYDRAGELLGQLDGSGNGLGFFLNPCGVTVDPDGVVYVADREEPGIVWRYEPVGGASAPISDADYEVTVALTSGTLGCSIAADSLGNVFVAASPNGPVRKFPASVFGAFEPPYPIASPETVAPAGTALSVDPVTDELYVNDGTQITVYAPGGTSQIQSYGQLSGSRGVALNTTSHHSYASNGTNVVEFGYVLPTNTKINHPAVLNATRQPETHSYDDFQVSSDGRFAAFSSTQPLTGYRNAGHYLLYRFDADSGDIDCASCPITGIDATADTMLPGYGLGLSDDGSVFFTSVEQLVLRDTNGKKDAYQWKDGQQQLISTGVSRLDSSLLGVTADGTDAFFFTNEVLTEEDENGNAMKLYDARADGGFPYLPAEKPCAASDECHGPGTQAPPPPNINTVKGGGPGRGNARPRRTRRCKRGFVKRRGRCVKKRSRRRAKKQRRHRRKRHHRGARNLRGGRNG